MIVAGVLPHVHAFDKRHTSIFQREARLGHETELQKRQADSDDSPGWLFVYIFLCVSRRVSQLAAFENQSHLNV